MPGGGGLYRNKRKFVPPGRLDGESGSKSATGGGGGPGRPIGAHGGSGGGGGGGGGGEGGEDLPPELQHCEKAMVEKIQREFIQSGDPVVFDVSS